MSHTNDIVTAAIAALQAMKTANGGACFDVVAADAKFTRTVLAMNGPYDLPLVGVASEGMPEVNARGKKTGSGDLLRNWHDGYHHLRVFVATRSTGGVESELTDATFGLYALCDRVFDLLAGKRAWKVNEAGAFLDEAGAVTTVLAERVLLAHPFEFVGDRPEPLPAEIAAEGVVAWSKAFRCEVRILPDRDEVTDPDEFERIDGAITPAPDEIDPDPDSPNGLRIEYHDEPTED